jgi:hypothetical protein
VNFGRTGALLLALAGAGAIAWASLSAQNNQDAGGELSPDIEQGNVAAPAPAPRPHIVAPPPIKTDTPMADRVAVLGMLNKRNGVARDISLHPGQGIRWGDLIVHLRACDSTADWEPEQLTGAFVQVDKHQPDGKWRRIFSGWLYKETPSLNVVEDPLWDVWPKSCTMRHPDMGPDTISAAAVSSSPRPTAKKSPVDAAPAGAEPSPSALSNSAI